MWSQSQRTNAPGDVVKLYARKAPGEVVVASLVRVETFQPRSDAAGEQLCPKITGVDGSLETIDDIHTDDESSSGRRPQEIRIKANELVSVGKARFIEPAQHEHRRPGAASASRTVTSNYGDTIDNDVAMRAWSKECEEI